MTLTPRTRRRLRRYWSDRLGVDPTAVGGSGVAIGAGDTDGFELLFRGDAVLLRHPESFADACERAADRLALLAAGDGEAVRDWLDGVAPMRTIHGPTFYGYADGETFEPIASDARVLDAADESAFEALRTAVPDDEWDQGGPEFVPGRTVGQFVGDGAEPRSADGRVARDSTTPSDRASGPSAREQTAKPRDDDLVATAGYDVWDDEIAHVAVVTHPNRRSEGHGRAVVSRVTECALADGLLPQYRTLDAWPWSVALAEGLGFERFATSYLGVPEK